MTQKNEQTKQHFLALLGLYSILVLHKDVTLNLGPFAQADLDCLSKPMITGEINHLNALRLIHKLIV